MERGDKLAKLLYYYLETRGAGDKFYNVENFNRSLLEVAAELEEPYGELVWATAAAVAVLGILQPGYNLSGELIISNEIISPVPDSLSVWLPYGLVENFTPSRRLCTPVNIAAYIIANKALEIFSRRSWSLYRSLRRVIASSWIGQASYCLSRSENIEVYLRRALEMIKNYEAPARFSRLIPFVESLLEGIPSVGRGHTRGIGLDRIKTVGKVYYDVFVELLALAGILEALGLDVSRESFLRRVFATTDYIVCYQHTLPACGLRPDIIVVDSSRDLVILVEVKSSVDLVSEGLKQLLLYREIIKSRGLPVNCEYNFNNININLVIVSPGIRARDDADSLICKDLQETLDLRVYDVEEIYKAFS